MAPANEIGTFEITHDAVLTWARLSSDYNRLHTDPAFAAQTTFGRTIAHGPLVASLICDWITSSLQDQWNGHLSIEMRFKAPVFVPSTLTVEHADVSQVASGRYDLRCRDQDGRDVVSARVEWAPR